jgi:hypothetical protein
MTDGTSRRPLLIGIAAGVPFLAVGVYQMVSRDLDIAGIVTWMAAGVVLHDFVLVPVVFALGAIVRRRAGGGSLAPLEAALIASGILILFSVPALSGKGVSAADPSRLPGDYPVDLAVLLAGVWIVAGCWALLGKRRSA